MYRYDLFLCRFDEIRMAIPYLDIDVHFLQYIVVIFKTLFSVVYPHSFGSIHFRVYHFHSNRLIHSRNRSTVDSVRFVSIRLPKSLSISTVQINNDKQLFLF